MTLIINVFLQISANADMIENAETAVEALALAVAKIAERQERVFVASFPEGIEKESVSYKGIRRTLKKINESAQEIGRGGDAFVVVSKTEKKENGVYESCYKFAKIAEKARGRNPMDYEMELQSQFHDLLESEEGLQIGVPQPFLYCEMAHQKFISMEKLPARSVDDLLRGFGSLPTWFDDEQIDLFCDELTKAIDLCHANGLYHRDLHVGNIMVAQAQAKEDAPKLGYIIDFGVSAHGVEGMDPYRTEGGGEVFTYSEYYGRIHHVRKQLKQLKARMV